jgi:hypothetical protein
MEPQIANELVEAVRETTNGPDAATADEIRAYLERHATVDLARVDLLPALAELAREGRIDSVSAAPAADGLPTYGFRPAP